MVPFWCGVGVVVSRSSLGSEGWSTLVPFHGVVIGDGLTSVFSGSSLDPESRVGLLSFRRWYDMLQRGHYSVGKVRWS